jgi:hypothetical protein
MYKRASLNQKFSKGHFKLAVAIGANAARASKAAVDDLIGMSVPPNASGAMDNVYNLNGLMDSGSLAANKAMDNVYNLNGLMDSGSLAANKAMSNIYNLGGLIPEAGSIGRNVGADILEGPLLSQGGAGGNIMAALENMYLNHGASGAMGLGAAGLAGLGSRAALGKIKGLQRTNPGMIARLMGAKPRGLTKNQLNAIAGGIGAGAGVGAASYGDDILSAVKGLV